MGVDVYGEGSVKINLAGKSEPKVGAGAKCERFAVILIKISGAVRTIIDTEQAVVSANGHWAQLWLSGSPEKSETVELVAERHGTSARMEYRFEQRTAGAMELRAQEGLQGSRRIM